MKTWKACFNCGHPHAGKDDCQVTVQHPMILGGPKKCSCRKFKEVKPNAGG